MKSEEAFILFVTRDADARREHCEALTPDKLDPSALSACRMVFLDLDIPARQIIRRIRSHQDPAVYLKPIHVRLDPRSEPDRYLRQVADGLTAEEDPYRHYLSHRASIDAIDARAADIRQTSFDDQKGDYHFTFKLIRYLLSRQIRLTPIATTESRFGYIHPNLDIFFPEQTYQQFTTLDFLESRSILEGDFQDAIHLCPHCFGAFLNFREICGDCRTADLSGEDLFHHFVCAYVGPESDFKAGGGEYQCPKCNKFLKHVGVDYDRPSMVYACRQCNKSFQEPEVDVACVNCGKISPPDLLILRAVKQYRLTGLGENSAKFGIMISLKEALAVELEIVELDIFKLFLKMEIDRIARYRLSQSTVGALFIQDFLDLFSRFGARAKEISAEISREIKQAVRTTDIISHLSDASLIFIFTETSAENARIVMERLRARIIELIDRNFDLKAALKVDCLPVDGKQSADALIENALLGM